jgi:hypothetical protein
MIDIPERYESLRIGEFLFSGSFKMSILDPWEGSLSLSSGLELGVMVSSIGSIAYASS